MKGRGSAVLIVFSNRLGCLGSLLISLIGSAVMVALMMWLG